LTLVEGNDVLVLALSTLVTVGKVSVGSVAELGTSWSNVEGAELSRVGWACAWLITRVAWLGGSDWTLLTLIEGNYIRFLALSAFISIGEICISTIFEFSTPWYKVESTELSRV